MADLANTAALSTNLNTDPYYDDFNEDKDFYRILFRPGLAVQARELTQLQTILQNQVTRFGSHIFKVGSIVQGCEINYDQQYAYVKLRNNNASGASANAAAWVGKLATGQTSGVAAIVIGSADGSEANTPNTKTLFVKYTTSGTSGVAKSFTLGEIITSNTGSLSANLMSSSAVGFGSRVTVGSGLIYAKGHFIRVAPQALVLEKYSANSTYRVGFTITESIIDSGTDTTLLDPAQGAYNYAAPGARRLKLSTTLNKYALTATSTNNFIEFLQTKNGVLQSLTDKPQYNAIRDYIAQRTYDINGNMVVYGHDVRLREHLLSGNNHGVYTSGAGGDSNKLVADIGPGKAYVLGYELQTLTSEHVNIDKATDSVLVESATIPANYGNYIIVGNVVGNWDVNAQSQVSLRDTHANAATTRVFSGGTAPGVEIGTGRVRAITHISGTPGSASAKYNLYLTDVTITTAGKSFANVACITYSAGAGNANGKADIIGTISSSAAVTDPSFNRAVFVIPAENIKRLRDSSSNIDNTWKFAKAYSGSFNSTGQLVLSTGASDETFSGSGALGTALARSRYHVILRGDGNSALLSGTVSTTNGSNTVTGSSTAFTTEINVGDVLKVTGLANTLVVSEITNATSLKTLAKATSTLSAKNIHKIFYTGQVLDLGGVGRNGARSITVSPSTTSTLEIRETLNSPSSLNATIIAQVNKVDGQETAKTINRNRIVLLKLSTHTNTTAGPWNLGLADGFKLVSVRKKTSTFTSTSQGTDVTSNFTLDNGQRDNFYSHAQLVKKPGSTLSLTSSDFLLVTLDYFTHSYSGGKGYLSVDSYPVNDSTAGTDTTKIYTYQIPIFVSPTTGSSFSLRDCVDNRPRMTDTANSVTSTTNMSTNPATSTSFDEPSGGLRFPWPGTDETFDLEYYLPRKDLVVMDRVCAHKIIKGVPAAIPQAPDVPSDSILLAQVNIAPYPSLSTDAARQAERPDFACDIIPAKNPTFRMQDIGILQNRIDNLEYYTSLSLLERDAQALGIADSNGNDRFKNGILVDSFVGHNIGNVFDPDYKCAIDHTTGELRPPFIMKPFELFYSAANSSNIVRTNVTVGGVSRDQTVTISNSQVIFSNGEIVTCGAFTGTLRYQAENRLYVEAATGTFPGTTTITGSTSGKSATTVTSTGTTTGPLLTLPYTHHALISQPYASQSRTVSGLNYVWAGTVTLTPDTDYWPDTIVRPDVQVNYDSNSDNWINIQNAWTTEWNNWQRYWSGVLTQLTQPTGPATAAQGWNILGRDMSESAAEIGNKQSRRGVRVASRPETITERNAGKAVDTSLAPFMRSRLIKVTATGLKPSTRFYAFFDDEDVTAYMTPTNSSFVATTAEGTATSSDSSGNFYALFRVPGTEALRFRVGAKIFRLTDSSTNKHDLGTVTSAAETIYTSMGLAGFLTSQLAATRQPRFNSGGIYPFWIVQQGRGAGSHGGSEGAPHIHDPLSQTFSVSGFRAGRVEGSGIYVTKVDLYFAAKDSTYPAYVELREVDPQTGLPSWKVVPFSTVTLQPADIRTSTTSKIPTPATFEAPVFLLNDHSYAIVVRAGGNNPNLKVFTSRLGDNDLVTGNKITAAPAAGLLYVPGNAETATAVENEDLKFTLYYANFNTAVSGTAVLKNEPKDTWAIANVSTAFTKAGEVIHGETVLTLTTTLTMNASIIAIGQTSVANGVLAVAASSTALQLKDLTLTPKFTNGETIRFIHANGTPIKSSGVNVTRIIKAITTPTAKVVAYDTTTTANTWLIVANVSYSNTGTAASQTTFVPEMYIKGQTDGGTARILAFPTAQADVAHIISDYILPSNTTMVTTAKFATSTSARDSSFNKVSLNTPIEFTAPRYIHARSIESNTSASSAALATNKSAEISLAFSTTSSHATPAVDLQRVGIIAIETLANSNAAIGTSEDNVKSGGNAKARYISRKVALSDGQDAEDILVYLTAYKPATAAISVYYKILHREDSDRFADAKWIPMTQSTATSVVSDGTNKNDTHEYKFTVPNYSNTYKSGANTTNSNILEYRNSSSARYVGYKYFAVKVVLTTTDTTNPPRVQDLRVLAMQI